jgi:hypothetical protein
MANSEKLDRKLLDAREALERASQAHETNKAHLEAVKQDRIDARVAVELGENGAETLLRNAEKRLSELSSAMDRSADEIAVKGAVVRRLEAMRRETRLAELDGARHQTIEGLLRTGKAVRKVLVQLRDLLDQAEDAVEFVVQSETEMAGLMPGRQPQRLGAAVPLDTNVDGALARLDAWEQDIERRRTAATAEPFLPPAVINVGVESGPKSGTRTPAVPMFPRNVPGPTMRILRTDGPEYVEERTS